MSKKTQATVVLIIMFLGFIFTYKLESFWGILLNHGFLAALIGGLADWFAVTALFRKPLGIISYRTEILPRNRERIMNEIVNFIGRDLLNPDYIISNIKNYDIVKMILEYAEKGGREKAKFAAKELLSQVIDTLDSKNVGYSLATALKSRRHNFNMSKIIIEFFIDLLRSPFGDKCISYFIVLIRKILPELLAKESVHEIIDDNVEKIKKEYIKDSQMRELMFDIVDLSSKHLVDKLNKKIFEYTDLLLEESEQRARFKVFIEEKLMLLSENKAYQKKIGQMEQYFFVKKFDFGNNLSAIIERFCNNDKNREQLWIDIDRFIDNYLEKLSTDLTLQEKVNKFFIDQITRIIQNNSQWGLNYIREELMKYSKDDFVDLVESRVGDDLQMIRINGSVIGAVAGMGLYVISFIVERMCA